MFFIHWAVISPSGTCSVDGHVSSLFDWSSGTGFFQVLRCSQFNVRVARSFGVDFYSIDGFKNYGTIKIFFYVEAVRSRFVSCLYFVAFLCFGYCISVKIVRDSFRVHIIERGFATTTYNNPTLVVAKHLKLNPTHSITYSKCKSLNSLKQTNQKIRVTDSYKINNKTTNLNPKAYFTLKKILLIW